LPSTKGIIEEFTVRENLIFWVQTYQSPLYVVYFSKSKIDIKGLFIKIITAILILSALAWISR
jgi:hypothetical protein